MEQLTNTIYKAVLYLRVSREDEQQEEAKTDEQGESSSISNQRLFLTQYCRTHTISIVGEYVDDGYSGTTFDRPGFQQMLDAVEDGKINCVLTKDLSRLGRNYIQTGYYIDFYFPSKGVRYIAVNDGIDSNKGENDAAPFLNILNEMQAKEISKKVKAALRAKFANGDHISPYAPLGYLKEPNNPCHLIPDEETKWIIEEIFTMAAYGKGAAAIRKELDKKEIPIPAWWIYERSGLLSDMFEGQPDERKHRWTVDMVNRILSNPVYLGHSAHYMQTSISFKNKKKIHRPEEDWFVVKDTHKPVISEEIWDQVQAHIQSRKRPTKQGTVQIFAGLIYCADCGRSLRYSCRKDKNGMIKYEYYSCNTYKDFGKERCSSHCIPYKVVYNAVKEKLQQLFALAKANRDLLVDMLTKKNNRRYESNAEKDKKELSKSEKRLKVLDNTFVKLYDDRVSGKVTESEYDKLSDYYRKEQAELEEKITALKAKLSKTASSKENAEKFVEIISTYDVVTELTAPMLNELIHKIIVHEAEKDENGNKSYFIEICFRFIGNID